MHMPNSQTLVIQTLGVFAAAFVAGCNSTSGPRAAVPCCDTNISAAVVHGEATPASPYVSPWLPPSARSPIPPGAFEDQSGRVMCLEHLGAPVALSFVYTRC